MNIGIFTFRGALNNPKIFLASIVFIAHLTPTHESNWPRVVGNK